MLAASGTVMFSAKLFALLQSSVTMFIHREAARQLEELQAQLLQSRETARQHEEVQAQLLHSKAELEHDQIEYIAQASTNVLVCFICCMPDKDAGPKQGPGMATGIFSTLKTQRACHWGQKPRWILETEVVVAHDLLQPALQ